MLGRLLIIGASAIIGQVGQGNTQDVLQCLNEQTRCGASCTTEACYQRCSERGFQCNINSLSSSGVDTSGIEDAHNTYNTRDHSDPHHTRSNAPSYRIAQDCIQLTLTDYGQTRWANSCGYTVSVSWYDQGSCRRGYTSSGFGCNTNVRPYSEATMTQIDGSYKFGACEAPGSPHLNSSGQFQCR